MIQQFLVLKTLIIHCLVVEHSFFFFFHSCHHVRFYSGFDCALSKGIVQKKEKQDEFESNHIFKKQFQLHYIL